MKIFTLSLLVALSLFAGVVDAAQGKMAKSQKVEDEMTAGLKCFEVGYRYGHTATNSMKEKKINPAWDFAVPERCRMDPETDKGIQAGTRAAW